VEENELFSIHDNPNPACPVGQHIQATIEPIFIHAQSAMESVLKHVTLADVVNDVATKSQAT
ncbi:MAG: Rrf2 family transcriptional regulator, partial [Exiguobacterium mexicanum]